MAKDSPARICAVITEETVAAARARMKEAAQVADMIEIRLDYLRDFDFTKPENLGSLLEDKPLAGHHHLSLNRRRRTPGD